MMSTLPLMAAAEEFVAIYHADAKLCADQADWECVVRLQASDAPQRVTIAVRDGRVRALSAGTETANLIVTAPLQILLDILQLRAQPEPTVHLRRTDRGGAGGRLHARRLCSEHALCARMLAARRNNASMTNRTKSE